MNTLCGNGAKFTVAFQKVQILWLIFGALLFQVTACMRIQLGFRQLAGCYQADGACLPECFVYSAELH